MQRDEGTCRYCGAPADCVDHVVPWAHRRDNSMGNLVAACMPCNVTGSDLIFPSFDAKRAYILARRKPPAAVPAAVPAADPADPDPNPLVTVVDAVWEDVADDDGPWLVLPDVQCSGVNSKGRRCQLLISECVYHANSVSAAQGDR
jgi:hypothetical protein